MNLVPFAKCFLLSHQGLSFENRSEFFQLFLVIWFLTDSFILIGLVSVPLVVNFLSNVIVFIRSKAFQKVSHGKDSPSLKLVLFIFISSSSVMFGTLLLVFTAIILFFIFELLENLQEPMDRLTLIVLIID